MTVCDCVTLNMCGASKGSNASNSPRNDHSRLSNVLLNLPIYISYIYIYTWESKIHHLECWTSRKIRRSSWICCWYQVLPLRFGQSTCIRRYTIIYSKKSLNNSSKTNLPKGTVWNRRPVSKQHKEATKKEVNCKGLDHSTLSKISAAIFISVWQGRIFCGFWSIQLCIVPPKRWMASSPVLLCFTKDSI